MRNEAALLRPRWVVVSVVEEQASGMMQSRVRGRVGGRRCNVEVALTADTMSREGVDEMQSCGEE